MSHDLSICLDSIWNQPLDGLLYEVICVDDCSTDGTRDWLHQQEKKHDNLFVIDNKENIRQGGARNVAIKKARGKYIMFIDQDDYYHSDAFSYVYSTLLNNNLDIMICDASVQYKGKVSNEKQLSLKCDECLSGKEFLLKYGLIIIAPWRMIINRNFYLKTGVLFEEKTRIEDIDWSLKIQYFADKVQYYPILLIHYIKVEMGTIDTMYKNPNTIRDNINASVRVFKILEMLLQGDKELCCIIKKVVDVNIFTSLKLLCGFSSSISKKRELILLIPKNYVANNKLVKLILLYPNIYVIFSNMVSIFYPIARKIWRKYKY